MKFKGMLKEYMQSDLADTPIEIILPTLVRTRDYHEFNDIKSTLLMFADPSVRKKIKYVELPGEHNEDVLRSVFAGVDMVGNGTYVAVFYNSTLNGTALKQMIQQYRKLMKSQGY